MSQARLAVNPKSAHGMSALRAPIRMLGSALRPQTDPKVADRLRSVSLYKYTIAPSGRTAVRDPATGFREKMAHMTNATRKKLFDLRYETGTDYYIVDLRQVREQEPRWGKKGVTKTAAHLKAEFGYDQDYKTRQSAKASVERRMNSNVAYETTYVTQGLKTHRLTRKTSPHFVATASARELDNPPMPEFGKGWFADFVTAPTYRQQGHGKRIKTATEAQMHRHTEPQGKARLYTEDHNVEMYEKMGAELLGTKIIPDEDGKDMAVKVFGQPTLNAESDLTALGVERLGEDGGQR